MQANKAAGPGVEPAVDSSGSSSCPAQQQKQATYSLEQIIGALNIITKKMTADDGKCTGACRNCAAATALIWRLEQEAIGIDVSTVFVKSLYVCLIKIAAALLKGGHSARAFRRTTEAFDW